MAAIFNKLNWKNQAEILVVSAPDSFEPELAALENATVRRNVDEVQEVTFALVFATKQSEVDELSRALAAKAKGDATLWFAYPKGSSRKYKCEFNRDTGWAVLNEMGFRPVRQVAIDEDWSALRFRRTEFVKA